METEGAPRWASRGYRTVAQNSHRTRRNTSNTVGRPLEHMGAHANVLGGATVGVRCLSRDSFITPGAVCVFFYTTNLKMLSGKSGVSPL